MIYHALLQHVSAFPALSPFHCGHGRHDYHTSKIRAVFHGIGLLFHFWDQGERSRNTWKTVAGKQEIFPLPYCYSLPSVLLLGWWDKSCCGVMKAGCLVTQVYRGYWAALRHCTVRLDMWTPFRVVFTFGNLQWNYPNCSLQYLGKTSLMT